MAITGTQRTSLIQIRVLDMDESVKFYRDILGLQEAGITRDGNVCFKGYDEFDHHSITLREADSPGMDFIGFKVESEDYLDYVEEQAKKHGYAYQIIAANSDQPGYGKRIAINMPTGHRFDFVATIEMAAQRPDIVNPNIWPKGIPPTGCGAVMLDHALLFGPNSQETVKFCTDILGMGKTEIAKTEDNDDLCTWLAAATRPHDIAILEYPQEAKLHHFGFKLNSWTDIGYAADILTINNVKIDAGPMRHGITRGYTIYFFDPSGNRLEFYAGGYAYYPDMPTRIWESAELGRGIFYYERKVKEDYLIVIT